MYEKQGNDYEISATQVVLCVGAIGTGAILLRSGIGPKEQLAKHDIFVIADLPVGQSLMDQPNVYLQVAINGDDATWPSNGGKVWEQSSLAEKDEIDIYLGFNHFANLAQSPTDKAFCVIACASRSSARGELQLDSADPQTLPRVSLNLLSVESDLQILIEAVEMNRRVLDQEPLKSRAVSICFSDGSPVPTDSAELKKVIVDHVDSTLHVTSTAPMGSENDPLAVTDSQGRGYGVEQLRVVDASIFPNVPLINPQPAIIVMAEVIAARMLDKPLRNANSGKTVKN